jgi:hypothetical protein
MHDHSFFALMPALSDALGMDDFILHLGDGITELVLVPYGVMHAVPFGALPVSGIPLSEALQHFMHTQFFTAGAGAPVSRSSG